jgi:hypothetical protein
MAIESTLDSSASSSGALEAMHVAYMKGLTKQ